MRCGSTQPIEPAQKPKLCISADYFYIFGPRPSAICFAALHAPEATSTSHLKPREIAARSPKIIKIIMLPARAKPEGQG